MMLNIGNIEGYNINLLIANSNFKMAMVNMDINEKSTEKGPFSSRPKNMILENIYLKEPSNPHDDTKEQLPEGTSSKSDDLSENE